MAKTSMQELVDYLKKQYAICLLDGRQHEANRLDKHIAVAISLLEKEKQQVVEARASLYSELLNIPINAPRKFAEEYFDKTYNQ